MLPISERAIRTSFLNASQRERTNLTLPDDFGTIDWSRRDYLGWRDPKLPGVGYVFAELDSGTVGVMLRESDGRFRSRPQCSWCEDVTLPNDVAFFSARRAGHAGRNGNTIATLLCDGFQCSANVRKRPPVAYAEFDPEVVVRQRIETLRANVRAFVQRIADGS